MAYVWICSGDNGAWSFDDREVCFACSKKKFQTRDEALKAARAHEKRCNLGGPTHIKRIHGNVKWETSGTRTFRM
jgi:hypothetical protein